MGHSDVVSMNPTEIVEALIATGRESDLDLARELLESPYMAFQPRPDRPEIGDEMTSFLTDDHPGKIVLGGTGCLAGDTLLFDPVAGISRRMEEIDGPFHVYSRNPLTGERAVGLACRPYCKGIAKLFRIELSSGLFFVGTSSHRVLDNRGTWRQVGSLRVGDALVSGTQHQQQICETALFRSSEACREWTGACGLEASLFHRTLVSRPPTDEEYACLQSATEFKSSQTSLTAERGPQHHHVSAITPVGQAEFWDISVWPHENYEHAGVIHHNSGKTFTTSWLLANILYTSPPPEPNTPVWILATTLDQVGLLWSQGLRKFIDPKDILHVRWRKTGLFPEVVQIKPDARGNSWNLYFYSCEQGREALQAATVYTAWIDEQSPSDVIEEVWGRLRRWQHANMFLLTCTPLSPDPWLQELWDRRDEPEIANLYKFYRLNTVCNDHLSEQWRRDFLASLSPDQRATRQFGDFANFKGAVFPEFTSDLIIEPINTEAMEQFIGVDFGFHHPAALWMARDGDTYYVIDEVQLNDAMPDQLATSIKRRYDYRHKVICDYEDIISARTLTAAGIHNGPCLGKKVVHSLLLMKDLFWRKKIKVFKTCVQAVRQLRGFRWKDFDEMADKEELDQLKPKVIKIRDHLVDCAKYIIWTTHRNKVTPWGQLKTEGIKLIPGKAGLPSVLRPNQAGWDPYHRR
jgi:phage terminase large subunit-like protein